MSKICLAIIFLSFKLIDVSFAQSSKGELQFYHINQNSKAKIVHAEEVELELNRDYWKSYITDSKSILTSPSGWERSDWVKTSLIIGITCGLYICDEDIQKWAQDNRDGNSDDIANFAEPFGNGFYTLPPLGILYLYGHFFENNKARRAGLLSLESFVVTGIFTQIIKFSGHRHRPNDSDSHDTWDGPGFSTSDLSFPSGHSSSAFAIATVLASEYDDNILIPLSLYSIAALTALSRVNDNAHWASDVFFGSAIGYFTAKAIIGLHDNKKDRSVTVLPVINDRQAALLFSYQF